MSALVADLKQLFPAESNDLLRSMFQRVEQHEKNWQSLRLLATTDNVAFWTIAAHHPKLVAVLDSFLQSLIQSYSAGSKRLSRDKHQSYCAVVSRLLLSLVPPAGSGKVPNPQSYANLLYQLFPTNNILPMALVLQKENIVAGSVILTALLIQCPAHLSRFRAVSGSFQDSINDLATRCVKEAKVGRYQRKSNDIIGLLESSYRLVKQLWATLHSCPMLANYLLLDKILAALRTVVDVIAPLLQYFAMSCDNLSARRAQLTKATATLTSCAIDTAVIATLFSSHHSGKERKRAYVLPKIVRAVDESIMEYTEQNNTGFVSALLRKTKSVDSTLSQLCAPVAEDERQRLGALLLLSCSPAPEGMPSSQRFGEAFISELVHQGVTIDHLIKAKFLLKDEAEALGATRDAVALSPGTSPQRSPALTPREEPLDPMAQIVLEVLPHFNPKAIPKAIEYYNGDLEHFMNDAMSCNLPPHLVDELEKPVDQPVPEQPPAAQSGGGGGGGYVLPGTAAATAAADSLFNPEKAATSGQDGSPTVHFGDDMHRFMSSDYHDVAFDTMDATAATNEYHGGAASGSTEFAMFERESTDQLFAVEDDLKDKIKMLSEMMYEDERDDAEDGIEGYKGREATTYDNSDDESPSKFRGGRGGGRHTDPNAQDRDRSRSRSPQAEPEAAAVPQRKTPPPAGLLEPTAPNPKTAYDKKAKVKRTTGPTQKGGKGDKGPANHAKQKGPKAKRKARIQANDD